MSHLVDYEEAVEGGDKREIALAALEVAVHKNTKSAAWSWAEEAADLAVELGIMNAHELLGRGRYPKTEDLVAQLKK
jgi:hypothetical protein